MNVIKQFPHCDPKVLHAPGKCQFCDTHPEWQQLRETWGICYTGQREHGKMMCPSEVARDIQDIDNWPGNRPYPK